MTSRIRILRDFLKQDPVLAPVSTQKGFAAGVGSTLALVRSVENGIAPVSKKLAGRIETALGVKSSWILGDGPEVPVPAATGNELTHEDVRERIKDFVAESRAAFVKAAQDVQRQRAASADCDPNVLMLEGLMRKYHAKCAELGLEIEFNSELIDAFKRIKELISAAQREAEQPPVNHRKGSRRATSEE